MPTVKAASQGWSDITNRVDSFANVLAASILKALTGNISPKTMCSLFQPCCLPGGRKRQQKERSKGVEQAAQMVLVKTIPLLLVAMASNLLAMASTKFRPNTHWCSDMSPDLLVSKSRWVTMKPTIEGKLDLQSFGPLGSFGCCEAKSTEDLEEQRKREEAQRLLEQQLREASGDEEIAAKYHGIIYYKVLYNKKLNNS